MSLFPPPKTEMDLPPTDTKFIVFKREDWEKRDRQLLPMLDSQIVKDAVVIRRQDLAAPPILDAYANFYLAMRDMLHQMDFIAFEDEILKCQELADYFHEQAVAAWTTERKLPT